MGDANLGEAGVGLQLAVFVTPPPPLPAAHVSLRLVDGPALLVATRLLHRFVDGGGSVGFLECGWPALEGKGDGMVEGQLCFAPFIVRWLLVR